MKRINALMVRNKLGEVLDMLDADRQPILISKGKQLRAVLISYDDFVLRFIDKQVEEEKKAFLDQAAAWRQQSGPHTLDPIRTLRQVRGYDE